MILLFDIVILNNSYSLKIPYYLGYVFLRDLAKKIRKFFYRKYVMIISKKRKRIQKKERAYYESQPKDTATNSESTI